MKRIATARRRDGFEVLHASATSQAAMMTLAPGETSSEATGNEHPWAEQWLYVVAGEGVAKLRGRHAALAPGVVVLIDRGEPHQIENTGSVPLATFNVYAPPAYDRDGEPLY